MNTQTWKRWQWITLGAGLFGVAFLLGLWWRFPGDGLANRLEIRLNQSPAYHVRIAPFQLSWRGLVSPLVQLTSVAGTPWASLRDLTVPWSWRLVMGLPLEAQVGRGGQLALQVGWGGMVGWGGTVAFQVSGVVLEEIPMVAQLDFARLIGQVEASGEWSLDPQTPMKGNLKATLTGFRLEGAKVMGIELPLVREDNLTLEVVAEGNVRLQTFTLKGDLDGAVTGTINLPQGSWLSATLQLGVNAGFRPEFLTALGPMAALMQTYMTNNRLDVVIQGPLMAPNIAKKG